MEKVVAIAKMSPGIVRFYFDSKAAMLVASLQFLAAEFEEQVLVPVTQLKSTPVAALESMVALYLDPTIASARKVSVWYAFWGEASSRQEYYDICGQKDARFAALVRELVERLIRETRQSHLDPDGISLGLIGVLEMLWQDFAFQTEDNIDRDAAKNRCMAYLRSIFPGQFAASLPSAIPQADAAAEHRHFAGWVYEDPGLLALERQCLFKSAWQLVGSTVQLARPGDFLAMDIGAERALVLRDSAGSVRAFRNCCSESPHALLVRDHGHIDKVIRCTQHGLEFGLDGRHLGVRGKDLFELELLPVGDLFFLSSLAALPARSSTAHEWLENRVPSGLRLLQPVSEFVLAADWKIVVEGWLDGALPEASDPLAAVHWVNIALLSDSMSGAIAWAAELSRNVSGWSLHQYLRLLGSSTPPQWRRLFMAPNQLFELRPDGLSVLQVLPLAPGRCILRRFDYTCCKSQRVAVLLSGLGDRLSPHARESAGMRAVSTQEGVCSFGYVSAVGLNVPRALAQFRRELIKIIPSIVRRWPPP